MADIKQPVEYVEESTMEKQTKSGEGVVGTIQLIEDGETVMIPTPSPDPRDPLNLPEWRKIFIVGNVSLYAATATLIASSFGAILPVIHEEYHHDPRINDLVTYPALFIGIGNLLFVPIAHAAGRRPVYLFSLAMLVGCCIWCARSGSLTSHIAGRNILSLAAGQAEALCPIMVQEVYFLHQRANRIAWFCALQTLGTATLTVASSYLASSLGWRWWYGVFAIINGFCLIMAIFTVPETRYKRSAAELRGEGTVSDPNTGETTTLHRVTTSHRVAVDNVNYPARTWKHDLALWDGQFRWQDALHCWKQMIQIVWFPNIIWLTLCSGAFLAIFVMFGAVFAGVLVSPPYNFSYDYVGFVFAGQVVVAFVVVPLQGYLSDWLIKVMGKRNGGQVEPETRFVTLIPPFIVAIVSTIIFGHACQNPTQWHWSAIVVSFNAEFYAFVGVVVASFTYVIDSYPAYTDAGLVILCFARGAISFGMSYGSLDFIDVSGYDGAFNICAIIVGVLGFLGIFVYWFGKSIRRFTGRFIAEKKEQ